MMPEQPSCHFPSFSVLTVFLLLSLVGLLLIPRLSVQLIPGRSYASVTVTSYLNGASAQATELALTKPLESAVARLRGVKNVYSYSVDGYASVTADLDKWTDPEMFRFEAAATMRDLYKKLPERAGYPQVVLNRPDDNDLGGPVMGYTLNGPGSASEIAEVAESRVRPALSTIKGIYQVDIQGALQQRTLLSTSTDSLTNAGLNFRELMSALVAGVQSTDLGILQTTKGRLNLFLEGGITSDVELSAYPISNKKGRIIRVADVVKIQQNHLPPSSYYRINGQNLISVSIRPESHVNTIRMVEKVKETLKEIEKKLPVGYRLSLSYDKSTYIKEELDRIYLRTGLSIGILILFVVLITRQWRYTFIVIASLGVNLLISFIFYYLLKLEIHLYSLAGITISIGLIIDNVIVIVEDIRHTGKNRIFAAILASTLTALGALSVIFLLEEAQRINLFDFAIAIVINLIVSLPVAYFFIPSALESVTVSNKNERNLFFRRRLLNRFCQWYMIQLHFMGRYRVAFFILFLFAFGLPLFMLPDRVEGENFGADLYNRTIGTAFYREHLKEPLKNYLGGALYLFIRSKGASGPSDPDKDGNVRLYVNISMPNGATLGQMDDVVRDFERYLSRFSKQLEIFTASVGGPTWATIAITFKKEYRTGFPLRLKRLLETQAIYAGSADFQVYGVGRGFNNAINLNEYDSSITLKGYNYDQLNQLALLLRDTLLLNQRVQDVLITPEGRYNQKLNYEYVMRFKDPVYLALNHTGRYAVGTNLHNNETTSQFAGLIHMHKGVYQRLDVALNPEMPPNIWLVLNQSIEVSKVGMLRLGEIVEMGRVKISGGIRRENQQYIINIHYRFLGTYMLNDLVRNRIIKDIQDKLPEGYTIYNPDNSYWGWGSDGNYRYLWLMFLVGLIIYIICAVLLESLIQPIAVVLMIPFSFIGVFLIFYLLNLNFDQGAYASLLMLAGLVTNAALYIINDINFLRRQRHYSKIDTVRVYIKAFSAKAIPVIVTTASAILSLLPFMISGGEKGFWFTLSAGTIGGLLFSLLGAWLLLPLCLMKSKIKKI